MQYTSGKDDWAVPDIVQTTDMNEIGANLNTLIFGGGQSAVPQPTAANDLDLNMTYSFQVVLGTTTIQRMRYTDGTNTREDGNIITLFFNNALTIPTTGFTTDSTYAPIAASTGITQLNVNAYDIIQFILLGSSTPLASVWYPIHLHNTGNG